MRIATLADVLSVLPAARLVGAPGAKRRAVGGISTDSRSLKRRDLFVALVGERFDGHGFVAQAADAAAALVNESWLADNPTLARSLRNRVPYLDPLNHLQIELLTRFRGGQTDERTRRAIHLTINGLAAGLRNSG